LKNIDLNLPLPLKLVERALAYFRRESNDRCWTWRGSLAGGGYGQFSIKVGGTSHSVRAHRIVYRIYNGSIDHSKDLHHICENKTCVNPSHLLEVDEATHMSEFSPGSVAYLNKRKTHCSRGHEYTADNIIPINGKWRRCATCRRGDWERWWNSKSDTEKNDIRAKDRIRKARK